MDEFLHCFLGSGYEEEAVERWAESEYLESGALEGEGLGVFDQQHLSYCLCKNYLQIQIKGGGELSYIIRNDSPKNMKVVLIYYIVGCLCG